MLYISVYICICTRRVVCEDRLVLCLTMGGCIQGDVVAGNYRLHVAGVLSVYGYFSGVTVTTEICVCNFSGQQLSEG